MTWDFNSRLGVELLHGLSVYTLRSARGMIKKWRRQHNAIRLHGFLRCRLPVPKALIPMDRGPTMHQLRHRATWIERSTIMGQRDDRNCRRERRKLDAQGWRRA